MRTLNWKLELRGDKRKEEMKVKSERKGEGMSVRAGTRGNHRHALRHSFPCVGFGTAAEKVT
ncbi:hypothetical protein E2C01_100009 [Portunus trituberculatus]|uniref:Uncharacterized protein n=1 Tax=Portunus trituberculatus TaxID=210409 RepID=A0A5B7KGU8_PORTR|nr:hypothetical protein [Portunus trituberculatus]